MGSDQTEEMTSADFALIIPSARIFLKHLHFPDQSHMLIDTAAITLQKVSSVSIC